jgi:hypothetical protein
VKIPKIIPIIKRNKFDCLAMTVIFIWSLPMLLSRGRIDWGDFSYFAQIYEAIKLSIVNYHQFPWWNPWIAGGIPLYANPQAGVFSITTVFVLFCSPPVALKLTVFVFYILGYWTFVRLLRYLGVQGLVTSLLGLVWVLNSFYVAHLPSHFTFIWFLVAPGFIELALRLKTVKSGVMLGLALSTMGLAQLHYSFIQISLAVVAILGVRLLVNRQDQKQIAIASLWTIGIFIVLCAHRIFFALNNINAFSRQIIDPTSRITESILGFFIPGNYNLFNLYRPPTEPFYGWGEQTVSPGTFVMTALLVSFLSLIYLMRVKKSKSFLIEARIRTALYVLLGAVATFAIGMGGRFELAPYHLLKMLPLMSSTRISARWFIFTLLCFLLFIGLMYAHPRAKGYQRFVIMTLCAVGVLELFVLNFGYHAKVLKHPTFGPPIKTTSLSFQQDIRFGESPTSPDGYAIPGTDKQYLYREYESTLFNVGTILANEVFVNLYDNYTPRCSYVAGCDFVLSKNAKVTYWSPNKIILKRTAPGRIELNTNRSDYLLVNGRRQADAGVADRFGRFVLPVTDSDKIVTLIYRPDLTLDRLKERAE